MADVTTIPGTMSVPAQQNSVSIPITDAKLSTVEQAVKQARSAVGSDQTAIATKCALVTDGNGATSFVVTWITVPDPDSATIS